jgi:hypothetical protein
LEVAIHWNVETLTPMSILSQRPFRFLLGHSRHVDPILRQRWLQCLCMTAAGFGAGFSHLFWDPRSSQISAKPQSFSKFQSQSFGDYWVAQMIFINIGLYCRVYLVVPCQSHTPRLYDFHQRCVGAMASLESTTDSGRTIIDRP